MSALIHGTYNAYKNKGCRCEECTRANRDYMREYRGSVSWEEYVAERKRSDKTPHGTTGRYWRHGCRCEICSKANTERLRVWRASKRRVAS